MASCSPCPEGFYSLNYGLSTSCTRCPDGYYSTDGLWCIPCPPGTVKVPTSNTCVSCPMGKYSGMVAASEEGACTPCPNQTRFTSSAGSTSARDCIAAPACPAGKMFAGQQCVQCPADQTTWGGSYPCGTCQDTGVLLESAVQGVTDGCPIIMHRHVPDSSGAGGFHLKGGNNYWPSTGLDYWLSTRWGNTYDYSNGTTFAAYASKRNFARWYGDRYWTQYDAYVEIEIPRYPLQLTYDIKISGYVPYGFPEVFQRFVDSRKKHTGSYGTPWSPVAFSIPWHTDNYDESGTYAHFSVTTPADVDMLQIRIRFNVWSVEGYTFNVHVYWNYNDRCPVGTYWDKSVASAQKTCKTCLQDYLWVPSASWYSFEEPCAGCDYTACANCYRTGYGYNVSTRECDKCGYGTFSLANSFSAPKMCIPCPAGKYYNKDLDPDHPDSSYYCYEINTLGEAWCEQNTACWACPNGYYSTEVAASSVSSCTRCPAGKFHLLGSSQTSCELCPAGKYGDMEGLYGDCMPCPPSMYSGSPGAWKCIQCPSGTFIDSSSTSACAECPAGEAHACVCTRTCKQAPTTILP